MRMQHRGVDEDRVIIVELGDVAAGGSPTPAPACRLAADYPSGSLVTLALACSRCPDVFHTFRAEQDPDGR